MPSKGLVTGSGSGSSWGNGVAFNNSSHISARITVVGIAVTISDEVTLTSVDVDTLVGIVPLHAVSKTIDRHENKIDLTLNKCLIRNDLFAI